MKAVKFSSFDEALAAFSLGPVRFVCSVCGGTHLSSTSGKTKCFSRFYAFCGRCPGCVGPQVLCPEDAFKNDPYAYPFAFLPLPKALLSEMRGLRSGALDLFYMASDAVKAAVLASPSPEREFCRLLRERQRKTREAIVRMPEYEGCLKLLSWIRSLRDPLSAVSISVYRPQRMPFDWLEASLTLKYKPPGLSVDGSWEVPSFHWAQSALSHAGYWKKLFRERMVVKGLRADGGVVSFDLVLEGATYKLEVDASRSVVVKKGEVS